MGWRFRVRPRGWWFSIRGSTRLRPGIWFSHYLPRGCCSTEEWQCVFVLLGVAIEVGKLKIGVSNITNKEEINDNWFSHSLVYTCSCGLWMLLLFGSCRPNSCRFEEEA